MTRETHGSTAYGLPEIQVRSGLGSSGWPVTLVELAGEHDAASQADLELALADLHEHVLVDLSRCEFVDLSIVNVVLAKHRELRRAGLTLELIIPPSQVPLSKTFDLLGIRNRVTIREARPPA